MKFIILFFSLIIIGTSCTTTLSKEKMNSQQINFLEIEFHDASVPPKYHRSYTLSFEKETTHLVVDSYGDIITDTLLNLTPEVIQDIYSLVKKHQIKSKEKNNANEGCTGGTGISIKYGHEKEVFCDGYLYFCGGTNEGNLKGSVKTFHNEIIQKIPEFNTYLKN